MTLDIGKKVLISGSYTLWDGAVGTIVGYLSQEKHPYTVEFLERNPCTRTKQCYFRGSEMISVEIETIGTKEENHE